MDTIRITQTNVPAGMIDFGVGQPELSLLPVEMLRRAAEHRLGLGDPAILAYGAEEGDGHFRLALADFLSRSYQAAVSAEQLFVTNGASQALDLICTLFTRPGDVIFVEEPSYFLALRIFADHHLQVVGLPTDEDGLIVEGLVEKLAEFQPALLYTIPTYHNPTATTLPLARRRRLVELSREHGFLIVADEVYQLLDYSGPPPPPMASFLEAGTILSLGSFSKILAPGLRLGWIQTSAVLRDRLIGSGLLDSGGGLNPFTSAVVRSTLELGWQQEHLDHLKGVYRDRAQALSQVLRQELGEIVSFQEPAGGFFIWCVLPEGVDTSQLLPAARKHSVSYQPGAKFSSLGGQRRAMRLCFAFYDEPAIHLGVQRLKKALTQATG